jgi:hypothetical protein
VKDSKHSGREHETAAELERREAHLRRERETWFAELSLPDKQRRLFELESLLKGLDRFFNVANLPLANMEQAIALNFMEEMEIVLQFVERVSELARGFLESSGHTEYQFEFYVGNRLMGDYERARWREMVLEQKTPEDSLFTLYTAFQNLRDVIRGLTQLKQVPYNVFVNAGSLVSREIISNRYFSPVRQVEFRKEFDRIDNRRIREIIRGVGPALLARHASIVVLAFNRLLQYLAFVDPRSESMEALKRSLLFFALIHSETKYLMEFMERNLPERLSGLDTPKVAEFLTTCDSLSFQLQMELKKIHSGELLNLAKQRKLSAVKTAVENSHGIFKNFFQQSIVALLQTFEPSLKGEEIFPVFLSRRRESIRVREDLGVLQAIMDKFEEVTETTELGMHLSTYVKYLVLQKGWIQRLREETVPFMRYQDLVEFEKYFGFVEGLNLDDLHLADELDKFKMESKFFKILVETTLGHIANRGDLQDEPLNAVRVQERMKRFVAQYDGDGVKIF